MWSKGAVVIKKYGKADWADSIAGTIGNGGAKDVEKEELKRDNDFMRKHVVEALEQKIADAERDYGHNFNPPKPLRWVMEGFALIIYWISVFTDKYLVIK